LASAFVEAPAWVHGIPFVGCAAPLVAVDTVGRVVVVTSGLLEANVIVYRLPWRVPRDDRTPLGYWLEALICSLPMGLCALMWLVLAPGDVRARLPDDWAPLWFGCAVLAGLVLVKLTRKRGLAEYSAPALIVGGWRSWPGIISSAVIRGGLAGFGCATSS
jgi:hypothetical protein